MDPLLEHYMPSLMALKKALPGRQPGSFIESFISVEFCVDEVFEDRGGLDMRRRRGKSSSLGMPKAPQVIFKETQASKLGDAPEGIPSFFNNYRYLFGFVSFMRYVQILERLLRLVFIFIL